MNERVRELRIKVAEVTAPTSRQEFHNKSHQSKISVTVVFFISFNFSVISKLRFHVSASYNKKKDQTHKALAVFLFASFMFLLAGEHVLKILRWTFPVPIEIYTCNVKQYI